MICTACTQGNHCMRKDCYCQHRPKGDGQLSVKRLSVTVPMSREVYEERKSINDIVSEVLKKYVNGEPYQWNGRISANLVKCAWCTKKVNLTRVGRVMHWHKDNRNTKYGKWGVKCPGSGKVNPESE